MPFRKFLFFFIFMLFFVIGCQEKGLNFTIRFPEISGLKVADAVVFEQNRIGKVTKITYTKEGSYLVDVVIPEEFANAVTTHSRLFIARDPRDRTKKAIEVVNVVKGTKPLEDGVTVDGTSETAVLLDQFRGGFNDTLKGLERSLTDMTESLRKIPESDAVKKLQKQLNDLMKTLKQKGTETRKKFEEEILPDLQKKMEQLRERLKKFGREKEMAPLEKEMENLKKI